MLDLLEKIVAGVAGLLILATLGGYGRLGMPSTTPRIFIPDTVVIDEPAPTASGASPTQVTAEDQAVLDLLAKQNVKVPAGQALPRQSRSVEAVHVEMLSAEANWIAELKKAESRTLHVGTKDTRLKIYNIQEDSLLKKFGIQENDVIELVDSQIIEFNETSAVRYQGLLKSAITKLRQGQSVSVTITRNGRPLHLQYRLPR